MKYLSICRVVSIVENLTERLNYIANEGEYIRNKILAELQEEETTIKSYSSKDYKAIKKELNKGLIFARRGNKLRDKYSNYINFANFDERQERFFIELDFFYL